MKIAVSHTHIYQGQPCNSGYCPVALAIREALYIRDKTEPNRIVVDVGDLIKVIGSGRNYQAKAPQQVVRFMQQFDTFHGGSGMKSKIEDVLKKVEPFVFELANL